MGQKPDEEAEDHGNSDHREHYVGDDYQRQDGQVRDDQGEEERVGFTNPTPASCRPGILVDETTEPVAAANRGLRSRMQRDHLW